MVGPHRQRRVHAVDGQKLGLGASMRLANSDNRLVDTDRVKKGRERRFCYPR